MALNPVAVANDNGPSSKDSLMAEVEKLFDGQRSAQPNAAQIPGGNQCDPKQIRSILNQPTTGGLLSAVESTVFLILNAGVLATPFGSIATSESIIVPPGFYLRLSGLMLRVDDEPLTVDVAILLAQQGAAQPKADWFVNTSAASQGANPNGLIIAGSNIGFVIETGEGFTSIVPGGFALTAQFFRNGVSTATGNCLFVILGTLMRDDNYDGFRTAS
jgi:hypothetical protein